MRWPSQLQNLKHAVFLQAGVFATRMLHDISIHLTIYWLHKCTCQRCPELNTSYAMAFSQLHEECCRSQSKCVHLQPTDAISINPVLLRLFETLLDLDSVNYWIHPKHSSVLSSNSWKWEQGGEGRKGGDQGTELMEDLSMPSTLPEGHHSHTHQHRQVRSLRQVQRMSYQTPSGDPSNLGPLHLQQSPEGSLSHEKWYESVVACSGSGDHRHSRSVLLLSPFPTWTYQHPLQLEGGSLSRRSSGKAELLPPLSPSKDTSGSGSEWIYAALVVLFPSSIRGTLLNSTPLNSLSSFWSPVPWYCLLLLPYCMCPDKGFFLFSLCLSIWAQQDWATLTSFSTIHCLPCWKNLISIPDNPTFSQSLDHGLME